MHWHDRRIGNSAVFSLLFVVELIYEFRVSTKNRREMSKINEL